MQNYSYLIGLTECPGAKITIFLTLKSKLLTKVVMSNF